MKHAAESTNRAPLVGVKILDLSRILAGPVCTQLLADLGADVVKVERPGEGDDTRAWGPPFLGEEDSAVHAPGPSAYFLSCNRGKRSLALDLGTPAGRAVVYDLVRQAEIVVENFLPDSARRLGLSLDDLRALKPDLVLCSISGFGRTGPLAGVGGYDLMIQASAGFMSITGEPDGAPMKVGVAITDVVTGLYAAASALAGLVGRHRNGAGRAFDLALADCTLASLVNVVQATLLTGQRPKRWGNAHPQIVPYESFATADGRLVLAIGADRQWRRFCAIIGQDAWASDDRFATNPSRVRNRETLVQRIQELMQLRSTSEWRRVLDEADIPHAPVLAIDEVLQTPQVAARQMVLPAVDAAERRYSILGGAVHWDGEPPREARVPPELGQHSREVLTEWLGYDAGRVQALIDAGVVATADDRQ